MNNIRIKILNINNNELLKKLLRSFKNQYNIEGIEEKDLTVEKLESIKPDIVISSLICRDLFVWKKKYSARLIQVFETLEDVSLDAQVDDFIVLNQADTKLRLAQVLKLHEQFFDLEHRFQKHYNFLSAMVHDLKTPLSAILGFAELLQEERISGELNQKQEKFVTQITNSANHLFQMVKDFLNYSIVESGRIQLDVKKQNLNDVLYQIYPEIAVLVKSREINYITSVPDNVYGYFDEERLRQVLENLISNAVKFTSKQGMIQVFASRVKKSLKITVRDTGIGMAAEDIEKVLDKENLFTTVGILGEKGTGLGVSICAEIMRAHGGTLSIESQLGEGTTVTLVFPDQTY